MSSGGVRPGGSGAPAGPGRDGTRRSPGARRVLVGMGAAWDAVRFVLVLEVTATLLAGGGAARWLTPWLLFGGSGSLLTAACAVLLASFPARYAAYLGLLRLGKAIGVASFVLLMLSGGLGAFVDRPVASVGPVTVTLGPVMLAVFALDLLFLAFYAGLRGEPGPAVPEAGPGGIDEPEVGHYH